MGTESPYSPLTLVVLSRNSCFCHESAGPGEHGARRGQAGEANSACPIGSGQPASHVGDPRGVKVSRGR
jgi:hypothetical protein